MNFTSIGKNCTIHNCTHTPQIFVGCDPLVPTNSAQPEMFDLSPCTYSVFLNVQDGCPLVDIGAITTKIQSVFYQLGWIMFIILIAIGLGIGVYGRKMWKAIIFVLLALTFTGLILVLINLRHYI